jgi:hypothetical protein
MDAASARSECRGEHSRPRFAANPLPSSSACLALHNSPCSATGCSAANSQSRSLKSRPAPTEVEKGSEAKAASKASESAPESPATAKASAESANRIAADEVVAFLTNPAGAIKTIRSQDELQLVRRPRLRTQSRAYGRPCVPAYFPAIWCHGRAAEPNHGPHLSIATAAG